jgi:hypothetical protein
MIPNVFTPEDSPGFNDFFEVGFDTNSNLIAPATIGLPVELIVVNRWGKQVFQSSDYRNDWNASEIESGVYFIHVKVGEQAACKNWLHIIK